MNRYAPPQVEIADVDPSGPSAAVQLLRNLAALVIGFVVGWLAVMGSRLLVPVTFKALIDLIAWTGRYSIGAAEFLTALPAAMIVGGLAYCVFTGTWRQIWWWGLSFALMFFALATVEPLLPDDSSRSLVIMSILEFSSFLLIGLTASLLEWRFPRRDRRGRGPSALNAHQ